ncbi:MAG: recombinase family protein [Proteobacteria bacterium]|nr:recombinase family protein [Pseudomonadota bacterium]
MIDFGTLPAEIDPVRIGKFWYVRVIDDARLLTIAYARVSSHDQRADLERQKLRLLEHAQRQRIQVDQVIAEAGQ